MAYNVKRTDSAGKYIVDHLGDTFCVDTVNDRVGAGGERRAGRGAGAARRYWTRGRRIDWGKGAQPKAT